MAKFFKVFKKLIIQRLKTVLEHKRKSPEDEISKLKLIFAMLACACSTLPNLSHPSLQGNRYQKNPDSSSPPCKSGILRTYFSTILKIIYIMSSLAISSLLWLYLLPLFSFSTNSHPTQTPRMCWNKSDHSPWAPWMKHQFSLSTPQCGPHSLLSLPGNSFTIRPWQCKCNTFAVNLMSPAPHP